MWGIVHMWDPRFVTLWDYLVSEAKIPHSWVYPTHGGDNGNVDDEWKTHIQCVGRDLPGPFVVISPRDGHNVQGEISLTDFEHPAECYYVFGSDRHNMALDDDAIALETGFFTVYIPGIGKSLHSPLAAAMVVYDRLSKGA